MSEVLRGAPPPLVVAMAAGLAAPEAVREALAFLTRDERREVSEAPVLAPARLRVRVGDEAHVRVEGEEAEAALGVQASAVGAKLKPEA